MIEGQHRSESRSYPRAVRLAWTVLLVSACAHSHRANPYLPVYEHLTQLLSGQPMCVSSEYHDRWPNSRGTEEAIPDSVRTDLEASGGSFVSGAGYLDRESYLLRFSKAETDGETWFVRSSIQSNRLGRTERGEERIESAVQGWLHEVKCERDCQLVDSRVTGWAHGVGVERAGRQLEGSHAVACRVDHLGSV